MFRRRRKRNLRKEMTREKDRVSSLLTRRETSSSIRLMKIMNGTRRRSEKR